MAFKSEVFKLLIASPNDVGEERSIIPDIINEWNSLNAEKTGKVIIPVKWELSSAPILGNRPQEIINKQLNIDHCDMLVGVFWTRIGSSTGISISGSVEEIERFVKLNKPTMLYFSQAPIEPLKIDIEQFVALRGFQEKMRLQGLIQVYQNIQDFRYKFARQLDINIQNILSKTNSKINTLKQGSHNNAPVPDEEINNTLKNIMKFIARPDGWAPASAMEIYLKTYTTIDFKKLGYNKLMDFLKSRKMFNIKEENKLPYIKLNNNF